MHMLNLKFHKFEQNNKEILQKLKLSCSLRRDKINNKNCCEFGHALLLLKSDFVKQIHLCKDYNQYPRKYHFIRI